jgi:hypothetical protein
MKSHQRIHIVWGIISVLILGSSLSFADDRDDRASLRGIEGVRIVVEDLDPEVVKDGLTEGQIRADVDLKLSVAGIKVLSEEENRKEKGHPWLYVNAAIMKTDSGSYVYTIFIEFNQDVRLVRDPDVEVSIGTWEVVHTGMTEKLSHIRERVKTHVDEFVNAFLSVNPRQGQTESD